MLIIAFVLAMAMGVRWLVAISENNGSLDDALTIAFRSFEVIAFVWLINKMY